VRFKRPLSDQTGHVAANAEELHDGRTVDAPPHFIARSKRVSTSRSNRSLGNTEPGRRGRVRPVSLDALTLPQHTDCAASHRTPASPSRSMAWHHLGRSSLDVLMVTGIEHDPGHRLNQSWERALPARLTPCGCRTQRLRPSTTGRFKALAIGRRARKASFRACGGFQAG